jgi:membrane protein DedA with SNARE-associated domain
LANSRRIEQLPKKAPLLIVLTIVIAIVVYVLFEILEDVFVGKTSVTNGPLVGAIISLTINVKDTVKSLKYIGIFILMLLESSSVPIPSEVILPYAGYLSSTGYVNVWITILVATVAGIAGSMIDYFVGLKGVQSLARHRILGRVLLSPTQLETAEKWFNKYGFVMVFIGRLIPGFRTLVSFPAGAVRMSVPKFVVLTIAGCIIWNVVLIYVGWYLGRNWVEVAGVSHYLILATVVVVAIVILVYLIKRKQRKAKVPKHEA